MEKQLFDWDGWDIVDDMFFQFLAVVLKVKIGEFSPGEKFEYAGMDYEKGQLTLGRDGAEFQFNLSLVVSA